MACLERKKKGKKRFGNGCCASNYFFLFGRCQVSGKYVVVPVVVVCGVKQGWRGKGWERKGKGGEEGDDGRRGMGKGEEDGER